MWILPKQLLTTFRSALDTKASDSDLEESSKILERSLWWRGKPSPFRVWLKRWKKVDWIKQLFGRIFVPSHTESFEDWWISRVEVSHVPPLAILDFASQTETSDTSTPSSNLELENADLPLFSWKMSKASSQQKQVKVSLFSSMSSEAWSRWVTQQRQEYSQRAKLAEDTREKEYLLWATPTARDWKDGTAKACKNSPVNSLLGRQIHHAKYLPQSTNLNTFGKDHELHQLNPAWTEDLMELPTGWTELVSWGTEYFLEQQNELLEYSPKN